jgi:hypothetical protein
MKELLLSLEGVYYAACKAMALGLLIDPLSLAACGGSGASAGQ